MRRALKLLGWGTVCAVTVFLTLGFALVLWDIWLQRQGSAGWTGQWRPPPPRTP